MATGDILSVVVNAQGWYADITVEGLGTGGTYSLGISAGSNIPTAPKISFSVTSAGYDATGGVTTLGRTVIGTHYKRAIYPTSTDGSPVPDETVSGSDVIVRVALDEPIYTSDTATVTILSGFYTESATPNNAFSGAVTNSSSEGYPKVVGNWAMADRDIVQDEFVISAVVFHRSAEQGCPVRCVKFSVTDESTNTVTSTITIPSKNECIETGNYVVEYEYAVDTSTLVDGDTLTCNFIAYPWYGDSAATLDTSDAVNTYPVAEYCEKYFKLDKVHTAYGRAVAVVDTSAGASPTVVDFTAFDDQSPPDAYDTIAAAINAIVAYNTTNFSRSNCSGGIIYLTEASHAWTGGSNAPGTTEFYLTIENFPGTTRDDVIISSVSGDNDAGEHTKFKGIYINSAGAIFTDEEFTYYENCRLNHTGSTLTLTADSIQCFKGCVVDATHSTLGSFSTTKIQTSLLRGCLVADAYNGRVDEYMFIGNTFLGVTTELTSTKPYQAQRDNLIVAYNKYTHTDGAAAAIRFYHTTETTSHGCAIVQNIIERARSVTNNSPLVYIAGDGTTGTPVNNVIEWHNVFVGQRVNGPYNDYALDGIGPGWRKQWSILNNLYHDWNYVTDIHKHGGPNPGDATRYGNHQSVHGNGLSGCVCSDEIGTTSFNPFFSGIYSVDPDPGNIDIDFVDDKSDGTNGDGLGNGDYQLGPSSVALTIAHLWVLPCAIDGATRSVDNQSGAYATESISKWFYNNMILNRRK